LDAVAAEPHRVGLAEGQADSGEIDGRLVAAGGLYDLHIEQCDIREVEVNRLGEDDADAPIDRNLPSSDGRSVFLPVGHELRRLNAVVGKTVLDGS